MSKIIEVIVSPAGTSRVQTAGFTGSSCQSASKFLEVALGSRLHEERTQEFYQPSRLDDHLYEAGDR